MYPLNNITLGHVVCFYSRRLSVVKGTSGLPKVDRLLKFLVDSSADCEEVVQCANCDLECKKQVRGGGVLVKSLRKLKK